MRAILHLVLICFLQVPAFALTFRGTITQWIESDDPYYGGGLTFVGYYSYSSPVVDGAFFTKDADKMEPMPPFSLGTLEGKVLMPFSATRYMDLGNGEWQREDGFGPMITSLLDTRNNGLLTVSGGQVTSFRWSWEQGGFYMYMSESSFGALSFYDSWFPTIHTGGRVVFGRPVAVADTSTSAYLLLLGLLSLSVFRVNRASSRL